MLLDICSPLSHRRSLESVQSKPQFIGARQFIREDSLESREIHFIRGYEQQFYSRSEKVEEEEI